MKKVYLTKNPNGDTRTATEHVSWEDFKEANRMHKDDVREVMCELSREIMQRGYDHDFTKISREAEFYENFSEAMMVPETNFTDLPWYKMHVAAERHHLYENVPVDVNLIDVLEMMVDIVCAAKTRGGEDAVISFNLDNDVLNKAVMNTLFMLDETIEVKDKETHCEFDVGGEGRIAF